MAGTITVTEDGLLGGDCADETMTSTVGVGVGEGGPEPPAFEVERIEIPGAGPIAIGVENIVMTVAGLVVRDDETNDITGPGPTVIGEFSNVTTVPGVVETGEVPLTAVGGLIVMVTTASGGLPGLPLIVIVVTGGGDVEADGMTMDMSVTVLGVLALPNEVATVTTDGELELGLAEARYVTTCGLLTLLKVVVIVETPIAVVAEFVAAAEPMTVTVAVVVVVTQADTADVDVDSATA